MPWTEQQKLLASDGAASDQFGASVAIDGDTAVVGAPYDDNGLGADAGAVYVYVRAAGVWTEQQKLLASDGAANDLFGFSVAIDGDTIVVGHGTPGFAYYIEKAYVFTRVAGVWTEQQILQPSVVNPGDMFGRRVAISGDTVAVGSDQDDTIGADAGAVYVFTRAAGVWTEQQKITATGGAASDQFGADVDIDGDTLVAGAIYHTDAFWHAGAVYAFTRAAGVWTQQQKMLASDGGASHNLGMRVAVNGDTVIAGTDGHNAAYVFTRVAGVWTEQQILVEAGNRFGMAEVDAFGDSAAVGAPNTDGSGEKVHCYTRSAGVWTLQQTIVASDAAADDDFGRSVAIDDSSMIIGSDFDDNAGGADAGAAYVELFSIPLPSPPPYNKTAGGGLLNPLRATIEAIGEEM